MVRKIVTLLLAALMICSLAACGNTSSKEENNSSENNTSAQEQADAASPIVSMNGNPDAPSKRPLLPENWNLTAGRATKS